jgi:hypothetical protein
MKPGEVKINLDMFGILMKNNIMGNMYSALIVTMNGRTNSLSVKSQHNHKSLEVVLASTQYSASMLDCVTTNYF